MVRIALATLFHERGKLLAALTGVAFAASLALAQCGLYVGFGAMATAVIRNVGGELWVMAKGTELLDFADPVATSVRGAAVSHPCVKRARGVVFSWATLRKPSGGVDNVQLVGFEPRTDEQLPWSFADGLPQDLHAPLRVTVDAADLHRLEIPEPAIGAELDFAGRRAFVGALTHGIKSFTVVPYLFAEARNAQRILGMGEHEYTFWALDLADPTCEADVRSAIEARPDLQAMRREDFETMTSDYWIKRSGAGATVGLSALLGLLVGVIIVGQTLFALTEGRLKELATLKAMGATNGELVRFVVTQAAVLGVVGGGLGVGFAFGMRWAARTYMGLTMQLSPGVLAVGLTAIFSMCGIASLASVRKVLKLEAAEVFR